MHNECTAHTYIVDDTPGEDRGRRGILTRYMRDCDIAQHSIAQLKYNTFLLQTNFNSG